MRLIVAALVAGALAVGAPASASAHTVTYDRYSFALDGQRVWLWSAEFHYFRLPSQALWRDQLEKLKAAGFNTVSLYFSWAYHSPAPGVFDFHGVRDIDRLLDIADDVGLYVIARPGPYINAELDAGGFPAWLTTQAGRARSSAADYHAAWEEWFAAVNRIIARHQFTDGRGSVILYQIENEYDGSDAAYMEQLKAAARRDGITVPLFHNDKGRNLRWASGPGAPDIYGTDTYPAGFDCNRTSFPGLTDYRFLRPGVGDRPFVWGEFQGGAFDPWGGPGYARCRELTGPAFERMFYANNIENQFSAQNLYMAYGGTSWGWQADPNVVYTSYDYGAAFNEFRQPTEKVPVLKQLGYLVATVRDLRRADDVGEVPGSNPAVRVWEKRDAQTGARFFFVRHAGNGTAATDDTTTFPVGDYAVPVRVNGHDFKILAADYAMGRQRLVLSTSEIYTHTRAGRRDVALLHGRRGEAGMTVLRYARRPRVRVLAGDVAVSWDRSRGDLRLDYVHDGVARVLVSGGGRAPLELLLADSDSASEFSRVSTGRGPLLVRGGELMRSAGWAGSALSLRGDASAAGPIEVFDARARRLRFDGHPVRARRTRSGSLVARVSGPRPVHLPRLGPWRYAPGAPESRPGFDDSAWRVASPPALATDVYGFHHGDVWYRGHFTATGSESALALTAGTGRAGAWQVWLNGEHLGTVRTGTASGNQNSSATFPLDRSLLRPGEDNVVSVLVRNMGHNEDGGSNDNHKAPRGLLSASLAGSDATLAWRIQGAAGLDRVRGPLNNGGLFGERAGWSLPAFRDRQWKTVSLPDRAGPAGIAWYRTRFSLHLPRRQDVPVGLRFTDDPQRHYRVLIFVNGWNLGQYVNDVGPQHVFVLPQGILRAHGANTLALAVWSDDDASAGLGDVDLEALANTVSPRPRR